MNAENAQKSAEHGFGIGDAQQADGNLFTIYGNPGEVLSWNIGHDFEEGSPREGDVLELSSGKAAPALHLDAAGDAVLRREGYRRTRAWEWMDPTAAYATVERLDPESMVMDCPQCGAAADEPCRDHCTAPEGQPAV